MPVTPMNNGWSSGNTPFARGEHITGAPARSARANKAGAASRAPKPAQMTNDSAASSLAQCATAARFTPGRVVAPGTDGKVCTESFGSGCASGAPCTAFGMLMCAT